MKTEMIFTVRRRQETERDAHVTLGDRQPTTAEVYLAAVPETNALMLIAQPPEALDGIRPGTRVRVIVEVIDE